MSVGAALAVGVCFGFLAMVLNVVVTIIQRKASANVGWVLVGVSFAVVFVIGAASGSFKSFLVALLGLGVGIATSALVTLPLLYLARSRFES